MIFRTVAYTESFDLNTVCRGDGFLFVRDGVGVAGRDALCEVSEPEALLFLQSLIPSVSTDSTFTHRGPILFALVPFSPQQQAEFVLPRIMFQKVEGEQSTVTLIGHNEDDLSDAYLSAAIAEALSAAPQQLVSSLAGHCSRPLPRCSHHCQRFRSFRAIAEGCYC